MCEIAVVDPSTTSEQDVFQLASTLYSEQGDGIGVLAVKRDEDAGKFRYDNYKSATPSWQRLWAFLGRHHQDSWRIILHARKQTDGSVNYQNTHPLRVNCEECDTDWMVHNGVVSNHKKIRGGLTSQGHDFNTDVDSEVIAHKFGDLPEDLDDIEEHAPTDLRGSLNYILASEDRIVAHFEQKYHVTDDFVVTCSTRRRKEPMKEEFPERANDSEWVMATPDGEVEDKERSVWYSGKGYSGSSRRSRYRKNRSSRSSSKKQSTGSGISSKQSGSDSETDDDNEYVSEVYEDLMPASDKVTAIRVAPGVIKVFEGKRSNDPRVEYIFRRDEPALYTYFATDEHYPGDEWIDFAKLFDADGNLRPADEVDDIMYRDEEKAVEDAVIENSTQAKIMEIVNGGGDEEDFR